MKIQHLKSATVMIESGGFRLLCDPWLVNGEYYGSWHHDPPYAGPIEDLEYDAMYISHVHPDHCSPLTLARLKNDRPVYIHQFATPILRKTIERYGFTVHEVPHGEAVRLGDGMTLRIYAADNCDPQQCGQWIGCAHMERKPGTTQIDTMAVVTDGTHTILNTNDCPFGLAELALRRALADHPVIDLLLVGYAGAGPYPQCFSFPTPEARTRAEATKRRHFLDMMIQYVNRVDARFVMPFAGTYTLGGIYGICNDKRGVPTLREAAIELAPPRDVVLLADGQWFDLGSRRAPRWPPEDQNWAPPIDFPYDYHGDPIPTLNELTDLMHRAFPRFEATRKAIGYTTDTPIVIRTKRAAAGFILYADDARSGFHLTYPLPYPIGRRFDRYLEIDTDSRLLARLLKGPRYAHWNTAEVGSHLFFDRHPDAYERGLHYCLCYLHA